MKQITKLLSATFAAQLVVGFIFPIMASAQMPFDENSEWRIFGCAQPGVDFSGPPFEPPLEYRVFFGGDTPDQSCEELLNSLSSSYELERVETSIGFAIEGGMTTRQVVVHYMKRKPGR